MVLIGSGFTPALVDIVEAYSSFHSHYPLIVATRPDEAVRSVLEAGEDGLRLILMLGIGADAKELQAVLQGVGTLDRVPMVVMLGHADDDAIQEAYLMGARSVVELPEKNRTEAIGEVFDYWLTVNRLPISNLVPPVSKKPVRA